MQIPLMRLQCGKPDDLTNGRADKVQVATATNGVRQDICNELSKLSISRQSWQRLGGRTFRCRHAVRRLFGRGLATLCRGQIFDGLYDADD